MRLAKALSSVKSNNGEINRSASGWDTCTMPLDPDPKKLVFLVVDPEWIGMCCSEFCTQTNDHSVPKELVIAVVQNFLDNDINYVLRSGYKHENSNYPARNCYLKQCWETHVIFFNLHFNISSFNLQLNVSFRIKFPKLAEQARKLVQQCCVAWGFRGGNFWLISIHTMSECERGRLIKTETIRTRLLTRIVTFMYRALAEIKGKTYSVAF